MKRESQSTIAWRPFLIELLVYAICVFAYFFLVLHFLGGWLKHLFDERRVLYAVMALGLIVVQGVALEALTSLLLRIVRNKSG